MIAIENFATTAYTTATSIVIASTATAGQQVSSIAPKSTSVPNDRARVAENVIFFLLGKMLLRILVQPAANGLLTGTSLLALLIYDIPYTRLIPCEIRPCDGDPACARRYHPYDLDPTCAPNVYHHDPGRKPGNYHCDHQSRCKSTCHSQLPLSTWNVNSESQSTD